MSLSEETLVLPEKEHIHEHVEEPTADVEMSIEKEPSPTPPVQDRPVKQEPVDKLAQAPPSDNDAILSIIKKEFEFEEFLKRHELAGILTLFNS